MKERPILFSAPMVRALLAGTKTQTRRAYATTVGSWNWVIRETGHGTRDPFLCPYGVSGDRLWVREAWRVGKGYDAVAGSTFKSPTVWYGADGAAPADRAGRYRHARFMPRWASRITIEITGVRVERLCEISRGDAMDEGCPFPNMARGDDPRQWYAGLWESINGAGSWDANPWVWVIGFTVLPR